MLREFQAKMLKGPRNLMNHTSLSRPRGHLALNEASRLKGIEIISFLFSLTALFCSKKNYDYFSLI